MSLRIETDQPSIRLDAHGTARVGASRVTLGTVIDAYRVGSTPESIVLQYPSLQLADVYAVVAYYLRHGAEVDEYLAGRRREADELRRQIEADPDMQRIRQRLLARKAAIDGARSA